MINLCEAGDEIESLDLFTKSEGLTGINLFGGVLCAPMLSDDLAVGVKVDAIAAKLRMTGLIDNFSDDEAGVIAWSKNFGTADSLLSHGKGTVDGVSCAVSAINAGNIAYWDAKPFGWAKSHSNRAVKSMSGTDRVVEYIDGADCEARRLRQAGVSTIVADVGWRTYGFETTHIDPVWQSLDRVRTFNRLLRAIMKAGKWARDREANELLWVKKSVVEFMNEMIGADVGIGFAVFFDNEKNTKATVTAGKFYLTVKFGDMPSVKELNIELVYSDDWNELLINYINGEG